MVKEVIDAASVQRWAQSKSFTALARLCSVLGTGIAGLGMYFFAQMADDIRAMRVALTEQRIELAVQRNTIDGHDRRLTALESRAAR